MTKKGFYLAINAIFLSFLASLSLAEGKTLKANISDNIVYIETFGEWAEGDAKGKYRVIIADGNSKRGTYSEIYVQWLDYSGEKATVSKSADIVPINRAKIYSLQAPVVLKSGLQFSGRNIFSGEKVNFRLDLEANGDYDIEFIDASDMVKPEKKLKGIPVGIDSYKRPTF